MRSRYGVTVHCLFGFFVCVVVVVFLFVVCSMFQAEHAFNTMDVALNFGMGDITLIAIYSVGTVSSSHKTLGQHQNDSI